MDKKYIGVAQTVIRTSDIKKIGNLICDELNCGDVVIKVSKTCEQETYQVIQKSSDKLAFCYVDDEKAIIVKYEKTEGVWAWKSSHETSISNEFTPEEQANLKKISEHLEYDDDGLFKTRDDGFIFHDIWGSGIDVEINDIGISIHDDEETTNMGVNGVDKVASGEANAGDVLTADGEGGTSFQPPAGGGTNLYQHYIELDDIAFYVISTKSTAYTLSDLSLTINMGLNGVISISNETNMDTWLFNPWYVVYDTNTKTLIACLCDGSTLINVDYTYEDTPTFTDTITPL